MIEFFTIVAIILIGINLYVYFLIDKKALVINQITTTILSALIFVGLYFAAVQWLSFRFDFWSNIGVLYGLTALFWIATKEIEKKQLSIIELSFLLVIPILFYVIYGQDIAINILLGIVPVVLGYILSNIIKNLNLSFNFKKIEKKEK